MTVLNISELNKGWGICGFTSVLGALYHTRPGMQTTVDTAVNKGHLDTRILAEIKTYLVILESESRSDLLKEITLFTQAFQGYGSFSIKSYIEKVNSIATNKPATDFSIAMPPIAVIDYLHRMYGMKNAHLVHDVHKAPINNVILGLGSGKSDGPKARWKGLGHWVYRRSKDTIYNWGKIETEKQLFGHKNLKNFQVVYTIQL